MSGATEGEGPSADRRRPGDLLRNEQDIQNRLDGQRFDFPSLLAVSNIYRAAGAVRRRAERDVLGPRNLSWGGFTILWVLWIWGDMETAPLAAECDLAKGTLTGMVNTLERQELVTKQRLDADKRRVEVSLTDHGRATIEDLFPRFNRFEQEVTDGLSEAEKAMLAELLRTVIVNAAPDTDTDIDSDG